MSGKKVRPPQQELFRLRINSRTVILVPAEKNNEDYARKVRTRMAKGDGGSGLRYLDG